MNIQRAIAKAKWYIRHERNQTATYTDIVNILEAGVQHTSDTCEVHEVQVTLPIDLARRFLNADKMRWDDQWAMLSEMEKVIKEQLK
jgi:hypothetical protein